METGWNYAQVVHVVDGSTTVYSNYITWIMDENTTEPTITPTSQTPSGGTENYLSGVKYYQSASVTFNYDINGAYRNFYYPLSNALSWTDTGLDNKSNEYLPTPSSSDNVDKVITRSDQRDLPTPSCYSSSSWTLGTSVSYSITVKHPYDSSGPSGWTPLTNESVGNINDTFMVYNSSSSSSCDTDTKEEFVTEDYRLRDHTVASQEPATATIYNSQTDVTAELNSGWDSSESLSTANPGYQGLMCYNGSLRSPIKTSDTGVANGDFSAITHPPSNVNYSGISTNSTERRYFYRAFKNTSGGAVNKWEMKVRGDNISSSSYTQIEPISTATYGTNNITIEIKVPGLTGWLDCAKTATGQLVDGYGILEPNYISGPTGAHYVSSTNERTISCSLGASGTLAGNYYIVVRVTADSTWIHALDKIEIDF